jgi:tRNA (cmo5U34)-methyltransferase
MTDSKANAFGAAHAQNYAQGPRRQVPGFADLHRMTSMLLAERAPSHGRLLVVGAGGGLELKALADDHPAWTFDGVDPSADMLQAAATLTSAHSERIRLHQGYVDAAPPGPFDGGTCLLTLHFVPRAERLETLSQIHRRLKPGAPFIVAHVSLPQSPSERSMWIKRHVAFAGTANATEAECIIASRLTILSPEEDEKLLCEAGFTGVSLFYAGLSFKGWVGYA